MSIEKVEPNGWAELRGLGTGDVLLKINGVDVDSVATLKTMLLAFVNQNLAASSSFASAGHALPSSKSSLAGETQPHQPMTRIVLGTLLLATQASAASGDLKAAAQKPSDAHRDSIVWLSVIAKTSMTTEGDAPQQLKAALQAQDKETKSEAIGTIVDPSGLVVTSLASIDKGSVVDGKTVNTPMGPIKLKSNTEIKEVKVIMPDGTEIPGDLVMKDVDLGLGFVKVRTDSKEAQGVTFQSINLADSSRGAMLDDCIGLGRLDENLNREASIITTEITGITTKPRTFYRVMTDATGGPIFLSTGKLLGISVMRQPRSDLGDGSMQMTPVVPPPQMWRKSPSRPNQRKPSPRRRRRRRPERKKRGSPRKRSRKPRQFPKRRPKVRARIRRGR